MSDMKNRARFIVLAGMLLLAMPGQSAALVANVVHLSGALHGVSAETLADSATADGYLLSTDAGLVGLQITGDVTAEVGSQVELTGSRLDDGEIAVDASSIVVVTPANSAAVGDAASPATKTTRKIAVIVGYYTDQVANPVTPTQAADAFTTNAASVKKYFATTSRGRQTATTDVYGPWSLGITSCAGGTGSIWANSINAMISVAGAHGVNLANYDNVVLWSKAPCRTSPWIGQAELPGKYVQILVDYSLYPSDEPALATMVAAHEIEHNMNLYHSQGMGCFDGSGNQVVLTGSNDCLYKSYGDEYTTMGSSGASDHALLDAERLRELGWLDPSEYRTVTAAGKYTLVPTYSGLAGLKELRIAAPGPVNTGHSGAWTIELRSALSGSAFDQFSGNSLPATTGVTIRYSENDGGGFGYSYLLDSVANGHRLTDYTCPACSYWDAPLQPGNTVTDRMGGLTITLNSVGAGGASVTIGDTQAPTSPGPLTATPVAAGGARLDWSAATDNLGLAGYHVYRDGRFVGDAAASAITYTDPPALGVSGLHTYSVKAFDSAGMTSGAVSATATLQTIPNAPTGVTVTPGNSAVRVSWTAPFNGGATITGYTVSSTPGGAHTCTTTGATSCVVIGLTNGNAYRFVVTAANGIGVGPASNPSAAAVPLKVPGRPTGVAGTAGKGLVNVSWDRPSDMGSGSFTGYTATSSPGGFQCTSTSTGCQITGLANGTPYTFTVIASSSVGGGLPSGPSAPITPRTTPDKPTGVAAVPASTAAVVTWAAPSFNGGSTITSYTVTSWPDGKRCTTATLSCQVTGLANRTSYQFSVTATNIAGAGAASGKSAAVVPLAGATYVPVTPSRLVDSRAGSAQTGLTAGLTSTVPARFQVTGRSSDPTKNIPANAVAVTGNLTAVSSGAQGYFSLTPLAPVGTPATSTLNFPAYDIRANSVTAPLGPGGTLWVTFVGSGGTVQVVFDVTGYFVPNPLAATYVPVTPTRLVDSRAGSQQRGLWASLSTKVPARFTATGGVIPPNAVAVTGNLTAVSTGGSGYFSLTPTAPVGVPATSTLNFPANDIRANAVVAPLGPGGSLWVTFVGPGAAMNVVFDVTGYFTPGPSGATYATVTPTRLVDSRAGVQQKGLYAPLTATVPVEFSGTGSVIPSGAVAVTGNLTEVSTGAQGYFSLTPVAPVGVPATSTLNFPARDIRANAVTAPLGPGGTLWVTFVGTGGQTNVVFDVSGYYTMG
ncbi:MAG TPA: fibronectin type III domain-containing protein [Candidatus Limnocylindrales bacterium]